jgi:hypothetical protein
VDDNGSTVELQGKNKAPCSNAAPECSLVFPFERGYVSRQRFFPHGEKRSIDPLLISRRYPAERACCPATE